MSDGPDNLILVFLRRLDEKADRLTSVVTDLAHRMTSLESKVVLLHRDSAGLSERLDRLDIRIGRIERRLDIAPA